LISCFEEIRIGGNEYLKGVRKRVAAINVNDVKNLRPNMKGEIVEILKVTL
jgi:hypothetical protein